MQQYFLYNHMHMWDHTYMVYFNICFRKQTFILSFLQGLFCYTTHIRGATGMCGLGNFIFIVSKFVFIYPDYATFFFIHPHTYVVYFIIYFRKRTFILSFLQGLFCCTAHIRGAT